MGERELAGCRLNYLLYLLDARGNRAEGNEDEASTLGNDVSQGGFACSRGSPEDERAYLATGDRGVENAPHAQNVFLSYELIQGAGSHAIGQG